MGAGGHALALRDRFRARQQAFERRDDIPLLCLWVEVISIKREAAGAA
jgi:hypothetical protein